MRTFSRRPLSPNRYLRETDRVDKARVGDFKDLLRDYVVAQRRQTSEAARSVGAVLEVRVIFINCTMAYVKAICILVAGPLPFGCGAKGIEGTSRDFSFKGRRAHH